MKASEKIIGTKKMFVSNLKKIDKYNLAKD